MKKKKTSNLVMFARVAKENGMTYGELQKKETLGRVKVIDGELINCKKR